MFAMAQPILVVQTERNFNNISAQTRGSEKIPLLLVLLLLLARRDYVPGELMLSPNSLHQRLSASASASVSASACVLAQCLRFQRCA